jgi:hypothetical protein
MSGDINLAKMTYVMAVTRTIAAGRVRVLDLSSAKGSNRALYIPLINAI